MAVLLRRPSPEEAVSEHSGRLAVGIRILDEKFRRSPGKFIVQAGLAVTTIMLLMGFHTLLESVALLAALGASSFIVFTVPHAPASGPRRLVGGYVCGVTVGVVCQLVVVSGWLDAVGLNAEAATTFLAGLGVGLAILLMVIFDMEHAPAASIALGLILGQWHPWNIAYVMGGIIVLSAVKWALRPLMIDLI